MNNIYNQNYNQIQVEDSPYVNNGVNEMNMGDEITTQKYNIVIGLTLLWGFFFNYLIVKFVDPVAIVSTLGFGFYILYFVLAFLGTWIFRKSSNPLISFLGYNLLVLPLGLALSILLYGYDATLISSAILMTGIITLVMMTLGIVFPKVFQGIGGALSAALIITIIVELISILFFGGTKPIIDYIVVLIFCGYIGYDWGKANSMPKTVDNAIDGAAAIYLDIINLFIRILRIMASSKRR